MNEGDSKLKEGSSAKQPQHSKVQIRGESIQFSGPLPPPAILDQYENTLQGAADRIIAMAEQQALHRRDIEKKVINSDISNSKLGLYLGFVIALAFIVGSIIIILQGCEISGLIIGIASMASLVGTFVYGSRKRRKERADNRDIKIEQTPNGQK